MNYYNTHRKPLLALIAVAIVSLASVGIAYGILIATFTGGEVTIGGETTGTITYSTDKETYSSTLSLPDPSTGWFAKLTIDGESEYAGQTVTIDWQLQRKTGDTTWTNVGEPIVTTTITLPTWGPTDVYASATGVDGGVFDWHLACGGTGVYRVVTFVYSTT